MNQEDKLFKEGIMSHFNEQSSRFKTNDYGSNMMHPILRQPYKYIEESFLTSIKNKDILDYCCGTGIYSITPALNGGNITGIDISDQSIEVARNRAKNFGVSDKCKFIVMDAEKLTFPDNHFDVIFSYGSFSYLDLKIIYKELHRVLRPGGKLVVVDSLAHNPIFRINRKKNLNSWAGKDAGKLQTLMSRDILMSKDYFSSLTIKHFDLISVLWYFLNLRLGITIINNLDRLILKIPLIRWLAFKVVFVCTKEK